MTLLELMIGAAIGLFVLTALCAHFVGMKTAFVARDQLSTLQDNERLAALVLSDAVGKAGYYPSPADTTAAASLPASTSALWGSFLAGQALAGTGGANDSLSVRFVTASGDGQTNCRGATNTSGANQLVTHVFRVSGTAFQCSTDGGASFATLAEGVSGLQLRYLVPVDTTATPPTYGWRTAAQVDTDALWNSVLAVRVVLAFQNPYAGQAGQAATLSWQQTVALMQKTS